jgi:hypothetical protein
MPVAAALRRVGDVECIATAPFFARWRYLCRIAGSATPVRTSSLVGPLAAAVVLWRRR